MAVAGIISLFVALSGVVYLALGRFSKPKPQAPAVKVALVTGCASGIGRGIAFRLASEGFHVALNDLETRGQDLAALKAEIAENYPSVKTVVVTANMTEEAQVESMIKRAVEKLGSLDVLIANAGIADGDSIMTTTKEQFNRVYSVNATGVFYCYKHAAKQMIAQGWGGKIIGASSYFGKQGQPMCPAYSASKFAVRGLTQSGAAEWGCHGITVNAYGPGLVTDTPLVRTALSSDAIYSALEEKEQCLTPSGKLATIEDVLNVASFLTSKASDYVTGQCIGVDGGRFLD